MHTINTKHFYTLLYYGEFAEAQVLGKHLHFDELWQSIMVW